jgi:hypothetical protein
MDARRVLQQVWWHHVGLFGCHKDGASHGALLSTPLHAGVVKRRKGLWPAKTYQSVVIVQDRQACDVVVHQNFECCSINDTVSIPSWKVCYSSLLFRCHFLDLQLCVISGLVLLQKYSKVLH